MSTQEKPPLKAGDDFYYIPNVYGGESYETMDECVEARGSGWLVCDHTMIDRYYELRAENESLRRDWGLAEQRLNDKFAAALVERDEALAENEALNLRIDEAIAALEFYRYTYDGGEKARETLAKLRGSNE